MTLGSIESIHIFLRGFVVAVAIFFHFAQNLRLFSYHFWFGEEELKVKDLCMGGDFITINILSTLKLCQN